MTVRHWRDQKVSELESLGPEGRNSKQEEQLKALILEREFQKRVEEMAMAEQREDESEEEEEVSRKDSPNPLFWNLHGLKL